MTDQRTVPVSEIDKKSFPELIENEAQQLDIENLNKCIYQNINEIAQEREKIVMKENVRAVYNFDEINYIKKLITMALNDICNECNNTPISEFKSLQGKLSGENKKIFDILINFKDNGFYEILNGHVKVYPDNYHILKDTDRKSLEEFLRNKKENIQAVYRLDEKDYKEKIITMALNNICKEYKKTPVREFESLKRKFSGENKKIFDILIRLKDNGLYEILHDQVVVYLDHTLNDTDRKSLEEFVNKECTKSSAMSEQDGIINVLLNCEKTRADIEPYEEKMLTDPNRGHWDLWPLVKNREKSSPEDMINLSTTLYARNPEADINTNGIIGIDFGTKSTVVAYQRDSAKILPMSIGDGNYSKGLNEKRFENPTIVHFINYDSFSKAYEKDTGRPKTRWNDLTISHTASDQFSSSKSKDFNCYLNHLKQWAGEGNTTIRLTIDNGKDILLPKFVDLKKDDINPIEIYAYYIGLYINNMKPQHGIYLNYYLSFPVTFNKRNRDKITDSFKKGIMKSFPESVLSNKNIMKKFSMESSISEPEAYAVCALKEYKLEPKDDEEVCYGVFDFGGGTTDFDFGLFKRMPEDSRYEFEIKEFAPGGEKYLGGENLLEKLAFEIFCFNKKEMLEKKFPFTKPASCSDFAGSDSFISDSQEAERNIYALKEVLRPYWETDNNEEGNNEHSEDEMIQLNVNLYDSSGKENINVKLEYPRKDIKQFFYQEIDDGVKSFFKTMVIAIHVTKETSLVDKVHIFLAGNSCRSPIVKKLFENEIKNQEKEIPVEFILYPPLGTEDADKKMDELKINYKSGDFEKPTCKTGVAFGLVECRKGGKIKTVKCIEKNEEIPFKYYIGKERSGNFHIFPSLNTNFGKLDYNKWYKCQKTEGESVFEFYYTSSPRWFETDIEIDDPEIKKIHCDVGKTSSNSFFYVKAVSPNELKYVSSVSDDVDKKHIGKIQIITLE